MGSFIAIVLVGLILVDVLVESAVVKKCEKQNKPDTNKALVHAGKRQKRSLSHLIKKLTNNGLTKLHNRSRAKPKHKRSGKKHLHHKKAFKP